VSKLTDASSSNPRWLVAFDEDSLPEEDIYESYFGKIIEKVHDNDDIKPQRATKSTNNKDTKNSATTSATSVTGPPNNVIQSRQKKKSVKSPTTISPEPTKVPSGTTEEISVSSKDKKSKMTDSEDDGKSDDSAAVRKKSQDREARRKRRQAIVEDEETKMAHQYHRGIINAASKKRAKGDDVIEVPMLTGTLLLYRGTNRRAEFIFKK